MDCDPLDAGHAASCPMCSALAEPEAPPPPPDVPSIAAFRQASARRTATLAAAVAAPIALLAAALSWPAPEPPPDPDVFAVLDGLYASQAALPGAERLSLLDPYADLEGDDR